MSSPLHLEPSARSVLILGAGASHPLPTAYELKTWVIDAALTYARPKNAVGLRAQILALLERPYMTLEALFSLFSYRLGDCFPVDKILQSAFDLGTLKRTARGPAYQTTRLYLLIALARKYAPDLLGPIMTTNFDIGLMKAHDIADVPYSVVTLSQVECFRTETSKIAGLENSIIPLHGTVGDTDNMSRANHAIAVSENAPERGTMSRFSGGYADPSTVFARGLARAFPLDFSQFIENTISSAESLTTFGYSGADEYDFNLLLEDIIATNPGTVNKFAWTSWKGDGTDLSPFARRHFENRIVKGDLAGLLEAELKRLNVSIPTDMDDVAVGADPLVGRDLKRQIRERLVWELQKEWSSRNVPRGDVDNLVEDIATNVVGAWVSLEHYYLESLGFNQDKIVFFGGADGSSCMFHGVNFASIIEGQRQYRIEQSDALNQITVELLGINASIHPASFDIFERLHQQGRQSLATGSSTRDVERALTLVACATAVDYQGLILRNRATAAGRPEVKKALALRAIDHFKTCQHYSELASASIGRKADAVDLDPIDELVGWRRWRTIALDNIPRAREIIDPIQALDEYRNVIDIRRSQLSAMQTNRNFGPEYIPAHIPQLLLRISEYMKCAVNVGKPVAALVGGDEMSALAREAGKLLDEYFMYTNLPNDRGIAVLEAISQLAVSRDEETLLDIVFEGLQRYRGKLSYRRCGQFVNNWRNQLESRRVGQDSTRQMIVDRILGRIADLENHG
ncbi:hypothetical protein [Pararhodospirillum photometricum]|uniref:hypothetical protein n=1 Tax=Pararhodospirillum photometricum TaxID=1084 RepID=UPI0012FEC047|nr:hypothetical protein [Pararhodospirillum photometricum]